ncbi:mitochondrial presequence translocase subunit Tim50 [Galdieria sulphuraria]|uniref:Mitochondrial import inner membrane translocase subunit TIM50 n=1 Tax=Galdieria sulphuraria TaxID=130081 RepID=M2XZ47_GALSU|nr:mitochondrial presequence translocase subunit Tim50 [Galdieria sulphuraria]EME28918.1 mitochondrial presequence translocase subunit Tim50 [Galdieria sulphuraria]|eukprot:XP_005705438.1 mitochondrial presequence translocase subunit Tim50 [Galdieria sulphuraria]
MVSLAALRQSFRRLKLNETQIGQCFRLLHENSKSNSGLATPNKRHMFSNFEESSSEKFNQQKQTNERRPFTWREYLMLTTSIVGLCTTCYYRFDSTKIFEDIETLLDKVSFQFNQKVISSLRRKFLPDPTQLAPDGLPRRTLVLDLDETLVYSQWKASEGWKTLVRPGVETFLEQMSHLYEIVLFTSSLPEHVDPIVRQIDSGGYISHVLYRDCIKREYGYSIKDLSRLNRDLKRTIIVDNEPQCFKYQPLNGIAVPSWKGNEDDRCLFELTSLLEYIVRQDVPDVRDVIEKYWRGELALSSTEFVR